MAVNIVSLQSRALIVHVIKPVINNEVKIQWYDSHNGKCIKQTNDKLWQMTNCLEWSWNVNVWGFALALSHFTKCNSVSNTYSPLYTYMSIHCMLYTLTGNTGNKFICLLQWYDTACLVHKLCNGNNITYFAYLTCQAKPLD